MRTFHVIAGLSAASMQPPPPAPLRSGRFNHPADPAPPPDPVPGSFEERLAAKVTELDAQGYDVELTFAPPLVMPGGIFLAALVGARPAPVQTAPADPPKLYRLEDVATLTGISRETIGKHARAGKITSVRVGRTVRIPQSEVTRLLGNQPTSPETTS